MIGPDIDALVMSALQSAGLGAAVMVLAPTEPQSRLPLVLARTVTGTAMDRRGLVSGTVDVQVMAATRRDASLLARRTADALWDACRTNYSADSAWLTRYAPVSGPPVEVRTGDPAPDVALFRYQFTCRITARTAP